MTSCGFILDEPMRPPESAGPPDSKDREHYGGKTGGAGPGGTGAFFESIGLGPGRRNAVLAGTTKVGGGVLLAMGLATPAAAAALSGMMTSAPKTRKARVPGRLMRCWARSAAGQAGHSPHLEPGRSRPRWKLARRDRNPPQQLKLLGRHPSRLTTVRTASTVDQVTSLHPAVPDRLSPGISVRSPAPRRALMRSRWARMV